MRKLFALAAGCLLASSANGAVVLYEPFDYTPGPTLENSVLTSLGQDWDRAGLTTSALTPVVAGSLTNPVSGQPASAGNSVTVGPGTTRAERLNFPIVSTGTIYYSLLLNPTDLDAQNPSVGGTASAVGAFLFGFNNGNADAGTNTPPSVLGARIQMRRDPSEAGISADEGDASLFNVGIFNSGTPTATDFAPGQYTVGQTLFIVASYEFVGALGGTDDIARLWINPNPATFDGLTGFDDTQVGGDVTTPGIQSIIVRNTGGLPSSSGIDEIRVSADFNDVIAGVPEPGTLSLAAIGGLALLRRRRAH
ncbi:MAG: PEP-CTERM sorting domain-containing protein [Tepidisphaeraceae bacterium]